MSRKVCLSIPALMLAAFSCANCLQMPVSLPEVYRPPYAIGYTTYFILRGSSSGTPAIDEQLQMALESTLADRAWLEVDPEYAQTVIVPHLATPAKQTLEAFYDGWGDWDWGAGRTDSGRAGQYTPGTLVVDFFDAGNKRLLWRVTTTGFVTSHSKSAAFPQAALGKLRKALPESGFAMASSVHTDTTPSTGVPTNPAIVFVEAPVNLVLIHGEPHYEDVPGTDLQRITNSRSFILRDLAGMHYARIGDYWMEAATLIGPWSRAGSVPNGAQAALERALTMQEVSLATAAPRAAAADMDGSSYDAPTVIVSTSPMTLVVTKGAPQFEQIQGTSLARMTNANIPVVKEPTDGELYVRVAGRWFRAWTTRGPWEWVSDDKLPSDFSKISPGLRQATSSPGSMSR